MNATQEIFAPEPQAGFDLGQPQQNGIAFPVSLAEKYQPNRIGEFVGLEHPKRLLMALAKKPRPCALLLIGPPGAGKTAMAMAFAEEVDGTLHHVAAQRCDVAELNALNEKFAYYPPRGQWWICVVDEADQMTEKAQLQLLSRLDGTASLKPKWGGGMERGTPPPVIWIFTSNGIGSDGTEPVSSFAPRFLSRCMTVAFPAVSQAELASYLEKIWSAEQGQGATSQEYFEYLADGVGVRDALMRLDVDLLSGPRAVPKPAAPIAAETTHTTDLVVSHRGRNRCHGDLAKIRHNAALKAWETRRARARSEERRTARA